MRVLQPSRLTPPAVVMASDFDEVTCNGQPWSWFSGRTVFLPDVVGDYEIETTAHAGTEVPHVINTRAPLQRCEYDAGSRELIIVCSGNASLPAGTPYTAVLGGPAPSRITNGEIVDEATLPHSDPAARGKAEAGGVLIRFRPGLTRVHYDT